MDSEDSAKKYEQIENLLMENAFRREKEGFRCHDWNNIRVSVSLKNIYIYMNSDGVLDTINILKGIHRNDQ